MCIAKEVKNDLSEAGFIINDEKSIWEPCQRIDWLHIFFEAKLLDRANIVM